MKSVKLSFGLLLAALSLASEEAVGLTLDEAQKIAAANSPVLEVSRSTVDVSKASLTRSTSQFYPKLGIESRYEYFDSTFERRRGGTANLYAEWNLFNGFQDFAARKARSFELEAARLGYDLAKQQMNWEVEAQFANVIALQESISFFKAALERNANNQKSARSRRAAGVVSDADVLEFDLYESILRSELAESENDLNESQARFRTLLGVETVQFPLVGLIQKYKLQSKLDELVLALPQTNIDIRTSMLDVKRANAGRNVARGGFLPEIRAFATYGSLGLRETEINPETYAGVVARWELFSGFDTWAAQREASATRARAEANLKTAQIGKRGELEQLHARLVALEYRIQLEEKNHEMAHKYLRTVSDEYRRGVKNSPDLKSANDNMLRSHLREVQLRSEYVEQAKLVRSLTSGKVLFEKLKSVPRREE